MYNEGSYRGGNLDTSKGDSRSLNYSSHDT